MISVLYLVLLIFVAAILINYIKNERHLLWNVFFVTFTMYYVLVPFILNLCEDNILIKESSTAYITIFNNSSEYDKLRAYFITIIVVVILVALRKFKWAVGISYNNVNHSKMSKMKSESDYLYLDKMIFRLGIVFLIIGGMALFWLSIELGGLQRMLALSNSIRGYRFDNSMFLSPIGAVCKTVSVFVTGSFFCFFSSKGNHACDKMPLVFSGVLSIIYLLFNAGRGPLLIFFGCIAFAILKKYGYNVKNIVIAAFILVAVSSQIIGDVMYNIMGGQFIFYDIDYNFLDNLIATVVDFTYPYSNLLAFPQMVDLNGYNYGMDYVLVFSELIPERLLPFISTFIPGGNLVTTDVSQFYISLGLTNGGTPVDYITYGLFQGGIIGVFINCVIFDVIIKGVDRIINTLPVRYSIIKYRLGFFAYSIITSGDIILMVKNNLFLIIILIVINYSLKKKVGIINVEE